MRMTKTLRGALLGAAALLSLGAPASAAEPGITDTEITIGLFAPMSGPLAAFGFDPLQAAKMWYEEINKKGGIHGRKIRFIVDEGGRVLLDRVDDEAEDPAMMPFLELLERDIAARPEAIRPGGRPLLPAIRRVPAWC